MAGHQPLIGPNVLLCLRRLPKIGTMLRSTPRGNPARLRLEDAIEHSNQQALLALEEILHELEPSSAGRPQACYQARRAIAIDGFAYLPKAAAAKRSGRSVRRLLELASKGQIRKQIVRDEQNGNRQLAVFDARDIDNLPRRAGPGRAPSPVAYRRQPVTR